jgi:hypothetical protein|tara:strand:+ start:1384 stop:2556 length:1173 start_codon:yes stop_codon:yes gene_type:complete
MSRVLFHSLTIPPDQVSTGILVADIAAKFHNKGTSIEVLASTPQYRFDSKEFSAEEMTKVKRNIYTSNYKGVKITHLYASKRSFNRITRLFQWISYHIKSITYLTKNRKNFDTIYIFSYPPTMNLIAIYSKKILKKKTVYSVWELYPEIASKLNELNSNLLLNLFKRIDNFCLRIIDNVVVNSEELKDYLVSRRNIEENKVNVIYHFSNEPEIPKPSIINKEIMYAGNLGTPQNLESFINIFSENTNKFNLTIYGSGSQYERISNMNSNNIKVNSFVDRKKLVELTKDIPYALVSLSPKLTVEGFPGKTFDYLKMNKILIGYSNPESGLAKFIEKYELGVNISPNVDNINEKFDQLQDKLFIDRVYKNITKVNNQLANINIIADRYLGLI